MIYTNNYDTHTHTHIYILTMEVIDLGQVGENTGQLVRVQHRPHLLEKNLIQDPQGPQVGHLCGEQLWR